jgi:REP element-mobilizing transposase RayT
LPLPFPLGNFRVMRPEDSAPRLKRLDWLFTRYPLYFVTTCSKDRRDRLAHDLVNQSFRAFCLNGRDCGVFVGRYVLMPDHLHLFVTFGAEYEAALVTRKESAAGAHYVHLFRPGSRV